MIKKIAPTPSQDTKHKAGFVHIVGKPNGGKSTLFNALVNYPLSIVTHKPQTTRQNILGIDQGKDYQVMYVDTPGYMVPAYALQSMMMRDVHRALRHGDVLLWVVDIRNPVLDDFVLAHIARTSVPWLLLLNKADLVSHEEAMARCKQQASVINNAGIVGLCAHKQADIALLSKKIISLLPAHPPYYDKETLTNRSERFFAANMIRKEILLHYRQEIPYTTEVLVEKFHEKEHVIVIEAMIYVERASQKGILIGRGGKALKQVGTKARQALEQFFKKSIFLTQSVKVLPNWRKNRNVLARWGYT